MIIVHWEGREEERVEGRVEGRGGEDKGQRIEEGKVGCVHVLNKLCHLCV